MSPLWTAQEIADVVEGVAQREFAATGVTFDSREVGPGDLFIALKGEATDGHRFVEQAFERGRGGALVSAEVDGPRMFGRRYVSGAERSRPGVARRAARAKVIGVTGSVGKTGTKEALVRGAGALGAGRARTAR